MQTWHEYCPGINGTPRFRHPTILAVYRVPGEGHTGQSPEVSLRASHRLHSEANGLGSRVFGQGLSISRPPISEPFMHYHHMNCDIKDSPKWVITRWVPITM